MQFAVTILLTGALALSAAALARVQQEPPRFDFRDPKVVSEWTPLNDISRFETSRQGLRIGITGPDPFIAGPARDYPAGQALWLRIRLKSSQGGIGQVFYYNPPAGPDEEHSFKFPVSASVWEDLRVPLPPLGPGTKLRFDPPGSGGECILSSLEVGPRVVFNEPAWPSPVPISKQEPTATLRSGRIQVKQSRTQYGGFEVNIDGASMAIGWNRPLVAYEFGDTVHWLDISKSARVTVKVTAKAVIVRATAKDPDGALWTLEQSFSANKAGDAVDVTSTVSVDRNRSVVFLPLLVLFPGAGSFGESRSQAVFPGLEYLDEHPTDLSSSEADIRGPEANRRVPDVEKITFPLMAIAAQKRCLGLLWQPDEDISTLFDSPDRVFHSGGHAFGLLFPGANPIDRVPGSLLPNGSVPLRAHQSVSVTATLVGESGDTIVPAIQRFVALRGLPSVPQTGLSEDAYVKLVASAWMDSGIRVGDKVRHAYFSGDAYPPTPAADAALYTRWLSDQTKNATLAKRLRSSSESLLRSVPAGQMNLAAVGHVRFPAEALVFGGALQEAARAREQAREMAEHFDPDGTIKYVAPASGDDLAATHYTRDANGLTAFAVSTLLDRVAQCGDRALIAKALQRLHGLDKYDNGVPRGAQTWEVPLHTPDILASAFLVRAYTLGYALSGEPALLERARYWAWTGLPFVYLDNPTDQPIGPYATIAVFGATHWVAPNWMGMPVQWCGLVYADSLYRLLPYDDSGPWKQVADGITASGIQQTCPLSDGVKVAGLLPDSFNIRPQSRNGPMINPGTVQTSAVRLFTSKSLYDMRVFRARGIIVHAPGPIGDALESPDGIRFSVDGWPKEPYDILLVGIQGEPHVFVNGIEKLPEGSEKQPGLGMTIRVRGKTHIQLRFPEAL